MFGIAFLISLLPILLILVGLVLLVRGIRGEADLSYPTCAKCGYDLRQRDLTAEGLACPECGLSLALPRAVNFGRYRRRPRMALAGAMLVLIPCALVGVSHYVTANRAMKSAQAQMAAFMSTLPASLKNKSNAELLQLIATTSNEPWAWEELLARMRADRLSDAEFATAIDQLIAHVQTSPHQTSIMMSWPGEFVSAAIERGLAKEQLTRLAEAYYKRDLEVKMRTTVRSTAPVYFFMHPGSSVDLPGMTTISTMESVTLSDGRTLPARNHANPDFTITSARNQPLSGEITMNIEPGNHTLKFMVKTWVVQGNPYARDGRSPPAIAQWCREIQTNVTIVPVDEPVITIRAGDPAMADQIRKAIQPRELRLRSKKAGQVEAQLYMGYSLSTPVPLSFDVWIQHGGDEFRVGRFTAGEAGGSTARFVATAPDDFDPSSGHVNVLLRPNVQAVERMFNTNQVWGEDILFEDVPVVRE